jgi:TPR repeat protein
LHNDPILAEGRGVPKDEARAAGLYRRAAELGDTYAQFNLAAMIDQGLGGLERDVSQAIKWFRRAADGGIHEANQPLAELLAERNRDRRDANEAIQRLMRVAAAGPPDTEYRIAAGDGSWAVVMREQGRVVAMPGLNRDELVGLPEED